MAKFYPVNKKHLKVYTKKELDDLVADPNAIMYPLQAKTDPPQPEKIEETADKPLPDGK